MPSLGELALWRNLVDPNEELRKAIVQGIPYMAGRLGAREVNRLSELVGYLGNSDPDSVASALKEMAAPWEYFEGSTVFPWLQGSKDSVAFLTLKYLDAMRATDLLGTWASGEAKFLPELGKAQLCRLGDLEPYYSQSPWSAWLEGKRVLVVHPFAETIRAQYSRRELLFEDSKVLPEFELLTVQPYMAGLREHAGSGKFREMYLDLVAEVKRVPFDIALIGAGWFGFPLAHDVKKMGRVAIHLGGASQLLFGIRGKRWDAMGFQFYNEYWVRPAPAETPVGFDSRTLDHGAYW